MTVDEFALPLVMLEVELVAAEEELSWPGLLHQVLGYRFRHWAVLRVHRPTLTLR